MNITVGKLNIIIHTGNWLLITRLNSFCNNVSDLVLLRKSVIFVVK